LTVSNKACLWVVLHVVNADLLIQMDGLMGKKQQSSKAGSSSAGAEEPQVFVLAATNMPWELDMVRCADVWLAKGLVQCRTEYQLHLKRLPVLLGFINHPGICVQWLLAALQR
jgi:hypothetical protein